MSDDVYLPKPIAVVLNAMPTIQDAYVLVRQRGHVPSKALREVLASTLAKQDLATVLWFLDGPRNAWPTTDAAAFERDLLDRLEGLYSTTRLVGHFAAETVRRSQLNMVDLAEAIATDGIDARIFSAARSTSDSDALSRFLRRNLATILNKAAESRTSIGRATRLGQARLVFRRVGERAVLAERDGVVGAGDRALWCAALHDALG